MSYKEKCESIEAETAKKASIEILCLQEELDGNRARTVEIESLQAKIDVHVSSEAKLQAEVKRLQTSLDSMSASNQEVIITLQSQNEQLLGDTREATGATETMMKRIDDLEAEVRLDHPQCLQLC